MADIEKVIKGLEHCTADDCSSQQCPYGIEGTNNCIERMTKDTLELLEEQKKQIETLEKVNAIKLNPEWHYVFDNYRKVVLCKNCKYYVPQFPLCKIYGVKDADWFCADGELR